MEIERVRDVYVCIGMHHLTTWMKELLLLLRCVCPTQFEVESLQRVFRNIQCLWYIYTPDFTVQCFAVFVLVRGKSYNKFSTHLKYPRVYIGVHLPHGSWSLWSMVILFLLMTRDPERENGQFDTMCAKCNNRKHCVCATQNTYKTTWSSNKLIYRVNHKSGRNTPQWRTLWHIKWITYCTWNNKLD